MYWTPDPNRPLTKMCSKCSAEKHLMEFHLNYPTGRRRPDCKACRRAQCRRYYAANAPACREKARRYKAAHPDRAKATVDAWKLRNPDRLKEYWRRQRRRFPRRNLVRRISRGLRQLGLLEVDDHCADCGGGPIHLHHPDYDDPWRVIPLCRSCHMRRHNAAWRRTGGGPVKYPEEYDDD